MKNNEESAKTFEELLRRYPDNEYKVPTYYNLYRVFLALENEEKSNYYKNLILDNYPDSEYANIITNPNYFKDQQRKVAIQKVFYANTFRAYLNKQYEDVLERKVMADSMFPGSELAPKFDGTIIHFGGIPYQSSQYEDSTKLGLYSAQDHKDQQRRIKWYERHFPSIKWDKENFARNRRLLLNTMDKKSASYLSARYLW